MNVIISKKNEIAEGQNSRIGIVIRIDIF